MVNLKSSHCAGKLSISVIGVTLPSLIVQGGLTGEGGTFSRHIVVRGDSCEGLEKFVLSVKPSILASVKVERRNEEEDDKMCFER